MTYRNRKLRAAAKESQCQWCGRDDGTVVAAHSNQQKHGKGMGIKADDRYIAFLCHACHHEIDQGGFLSKDARRAIWDIAHQRTVRLLIDKGLLEATDDLGAGQAGAEGPTAIRPWPDVHSEDDKGL